MTRKEILILAALGVFVVALIVFGFATQNPSDVNTGLNYSKEAEKKSNEILYGSSTKPSADYTSSVPEDATVTQGKMEAPASANDALDTKLRFYDIKASKNGFEPNTITVNSGDSVELNLTAVDGDYDVDFAYLGAYFPVVKKGETKKLPLSTNLSGTFTFQCKDFCPLGGVIKGSLIVLP